MRTRSRWATLTALGLVTTAARGTTAPSGPTRTITEADCTGEKLGTTIPSAAIGEPVASMTLSAPAWTADTSDAPAYCSVDGSMAPIDTAATAKPINFLVVLPASWS